MPYGVITAAQRPVPMVNQALRYDITPDAGADAVPAIFSPSTGSAWSVLCALHPADSPAHRAQS